jgi:predicted AlkP superfamily pyrophosphatase or phosphodiesterase
MLRPPSVRLSGLLLLIAIVFACLSSAAIAQPDPTAPPRLLVVLSIDQMCQEYLIRFQDNFPAGPRESFFRNVLANGAWFANCHHAQAFTITAPGHSVQLTGCYPNTNGIIENEWFDRATGKTRYCCADPDEEVVGITTGKPMSPRALLVDTVGDRLKLATGGKAKVFGVAIKDRAAILMTGHRADAAYWLEKNQWVTSTYYRRDLPGYFRTLNEGKAIEQYHGKTWDLLLAKERYVNQGIDDSVHENPPAGWTAAFPHKLAKAGELTPEKFGEHVLFSPFGNDYTLLAAREIIEHEKLGADDVPDLLTINFSTNDYIGHAFGPYSFEVEDIVYRTDRQLADFVRFLDQQVGAGRWTFALTADHGVAPIPEAVAEAAQGGQQALPAKRNPIGELKVVREKLEKVLESELDVALHEKVILDLDSNQIYLNHDHKQLNAASLVKARQVIRDWLLKQPYVAAAYTREELIAGGDSRLLAQFRLSFNHLRSGDVLYCFTPYSIPGLQTATAKPKGTTHGSPWHYDTHVPLLLLGRGIVPGKQERRISPAYLAPTAARLFGIDAPGGCEHEPLLEVLVPSKRY